jgi:predicted N-acetyltransferase YhbS
VSPAVPGDEVIRPATEADDAAVLDLLAASMGWVPDEQHAGFLTWKHRENPAGPSPAWVAEVDGEVVAFRTFLRWPFEWDGRRVAAVRAVDTATHPDHQGRGLFSRLTLHAVSELAADGVDFVFNTPNDRSRPGYLKMGWELVGRPAVRARPRSIGALVPMLRARVPATRWSMPTTAAEPAAAVLADADAVTALLGTVADPGGLSTRRTVDHLRWRYGFEPLAYRAAVASGGVADGLVVFRLRQRGPAIELAVCEELVPDGAQGQADDLVATALRAAGAHHAIRLTGQAGGRRYLPLPGQGPTLVWRAVGLDQRPALEDWHLSLGDVEVL